MISVQLPKEIWIMIIEDFYVKDSSAQQAIVFKSFENLRSLMLVNKYFHDLVLPILYKHVYIKSRYQYYLFLNVLNERPHYSEYIEVLTLKFDCDIIKERSYLYSLINTRMPKLKSLLGMPTYRASPSLLRKDFKINEQLVSLDLRQIYDFEIFGYSNVPFPKLKDVKIPSDKRHTPIILHYLGFPYIEYKLFEKYYQKNRNQFHELSEIKKAYEFLFSTNDSLPKSYFPKLQSFCLRYNTVYYDYIVYLNLLCAVIGLPSLLEFKLEGKYEGSPPKILDKFLSKRPSNFRFICDSSV